MGLVSVGSGAKSAPVFSASNYLTEAYTDGQYKYLRLENFAKKEVKTVLWNAGETTEWNGMSFYATRVPSTGWDVKNTQRVNINGKVLEAGTVSAHYVIGGPNISTGFFLAWTVEK